MLDQALAMSFFRAISPLNIVTTYAIKPKIANKNASETIVFMGFLSPILYHQSKYAAAM